MLTGVATGERGGAGVTIGDGGRVGVTSGDCEGVSVGGFEGVTVGGRGVAVGGTHAARTKIIARTNRIFMNLHFIAVVSVLNRNSIDQKLESDRVGEIAPRNVQSVRDL